jgi:hypothetical protein
MIRAVMVDPKQPMDIRLHCAAALEKREPDGADKPKRQYDIKLLTDREKSVLCSRQAFSAVSLSAGRGIRGGGVPSEDELAEFAF